MATPDPSKMPSGSTAPAADARATRRPSLIVNALSNWTGLAVNVVVGLCLTPYVIMCLGQSGYGIWTLVGALIGYYGLLDLGVGSAVTRYVARYAGQKNQQALDETLAAALLVFGIIGTAIPILALCTIDTLAAFFHVDAQALPAFRTAFLLLSLSTALNLLGQAFRATIRAHEYFVVRNGIAICATLVRAGMTVWLLSRGMGLVAIAYAYVLAECMTFVVHVVAVRRLVPSARFDIRLARGARVKKLLTYGLSTTVVMVAGVVVNHLDSVVIGRIISLEAVAVYGVAAVIMRYYHHLLFSGSGVLAPRFARLQGAGELDQFRRLLLRTTWISAALSFGTALLLVTVGEPFIAAWVGPDYGQAATVLVVLVMAAAVNLAQYPAIVAIYALNKHHYLAVATVVEALLNLSLSIVLAYRLGIVGVAAGTMLPSLILRVFVQPVYVTRVVGLTLWSYGRPLLAMACTAVFTLVLWHEWLAPVELPVGMVQCALVAAQLAGLYGVCVAVVFGPALLSRIERRGGLACVLRSALAGRDKAVKS